MVIKQYRCFLQLETTPMCLPILLCADTTELLSTEESVAKSRGQWTPKAIEVHDCETSTCTTSTRSRRIHPTMFLDNHLTRIIQSKYEQPSVYDRSSQSPLSQNDEICEFRVLPQKLHRILWNKNDAISVRKLTITQSKMCAY